MNEIVSRFQSLSADDWWALGLCCFLGVCLLTWAVTETWERGKEVTPVEAALTNRELLAMLNDDILPRPAREATVSSITGFRQSHTR